jgi:hypothetical protein
MDDRNKLLVVYFEYLRNFPKNVEASYANITARNFYL